MNIPYFERDSCTIVVYEFFFSFNCKVLWFWQTQFLIVKPFLVMINKVGLPQDLFLLTFFIFPWFHAFWDMRLNMIWNVNSFHMQESNVDEREHTMGFFTCIIIMVNLLEGMQWQILRQFVNFNCITWILNLDLV